MSEHLTLADRLRALDSQAEAESLPFLIPNEDLDRAADAADACENVSEADLLFLASRGGLAALLCEAQFLLDRIDSLDWSVDLEEFFRDWNGHVEPPLCRLRALLPQTGEGARDSGIDVFLSDVRAEFHRGRAKFPGNELKTVALSEEFGELVKAVLDEAAADVRKEAVQLAAMCLRLVIDGDSSVDGWRERNGLDSLSKREDGT